MPDILLQCEKDGLMAYFTIAEQTVNTLTMPYLLSLLKQRHVVYGINKTALIEIAEGKHRGERVVIASGNPMQAGTDGRLEWYIDLSKTGKPKERANGSVDLRELQIDCNVAKGDALVRIIPPVSGVAGMTVFGTPIEAPSVKGVYLGMGDGVEFDAERPGYVIAAIDGAVYFDGKELEIRDRKIIGGDIGYTTGNVTFKGDLKIGGSVRSGFSVHAEGNISIGGDVEDAEIRCGGMLSIAGGAIGSGNGKISCSGSVKLHHVSHFTIAVSDDLLVAEDVLHSLIDADGNVQARSIIGGETRGFSVSVESIGSTAEVRTVVDIGCISQLNRERYELLREFGVLSKKRVEQFDDLFRLVRDGMDENGMLSEGNVLVLDSMKSDTIDSIEKAGEIQKRLERIDGIEKMQEGTPLIKAATIYPNAVLKNGREERMFQEITKNVVIAGKKKVPEESR